MSSNSPSAACRRRIDFCGGMRERMRHIVLIRRLFLLAIGAVFLVCATAMAVLAYPQPLYSHHTAKGRLELYSDRPFNDGRGQILLTEIERRLSQAPGGLADHEGTYRIFVTNEPWRRRLVFLWAYRAAGVNFYPFSSGVFLRQADIDNDRLLKGDGTPVAPPRTLSYYASHEIGHSLIGRRIGFIANRRLPVWIREGMADYIGFGGKVDLVALLQALRSGDPELDPRRSRTYARYRLLVAYFLEHERWTADRLLASGMTQAQAEQRLGTLRVP